MFAIFYSPPTVDVCVTVDLLQKILCGKAASTAGLALHFVFACCACTQLTRTPELRNNFVGRLQNILDSARVSGITGFDSTPFYQYVNFACKMCFCNLHKKIKHLHQVSTRNCRNLAPFLILVRNFLQGQVRFVLPFTFSAPKSPPARVMIGTGIPGSNHHFLRAQKLTCRICFFFAPSISVTAKCLET